MLEIRMPYNHIYDYLGHTRLNVWFTPDPAEQFHNPYLAMGNNPVVYVDPDGEFIGTAITAVVDFLRVGFTEGGFELWNWGNKNFNDAWREYDPSAEWSRTNKAFKVDAGWFKTDPEKNFFGRAWELTSRYTWQLPQMLVGNAISHGINISGNVNEVNYFGGATVLDTEIEGGAFTVGSYINGPRGFKPDFRDHLFVHEYGHYRQSQRLGPLYLSWVALPSVTDFAIDELFGTDLHDTRWYEAQASRLSADYFDEHYGSGAEGYTSGSPDYFDRNSFVNGGITSPYQNPRNLRFNFGGNPQKSKFHWTDIPINLLYNGGYGLFGFFF